MKEYTKIYFEYFNYGTHDFIPCEICGSRAVDIHHIDCKGMGSSNDKDVIENLMAMCRTDHLKYGDKKQFTEWLKNIHKNFMRNETAAE